MVTNNIEFYEPDKDKDEKNTKSSMKLPLDDQEIIKKIIRS